MRKRGAVFEVDLHGQAFTARVDGAGIEITPRGIEGAETRRVTWENVLQPETTPTPAAPEAPATPSTEEDIPF